MEQRKRIAIYGGTFDPVHLGHMEIARRVTQLFEIDQFLFVPARVAPHKFDREVSPALHRYAMLALATNAEPRLSISTFELDGPGRQYTVDTLSWFRSRFGDAGDLFFVMGADSWAEITTWYEWRRLLTLTNLIVVTRPGYDIRSEHVGAETAGKVIDFRESVAGEHPSVIEQGVQKIFVTDAVMVDVSATEIRRAAENASDELTSLVPMEVAEYIRKYQLYRNRHEE
ncbi:MAG TPA: nicotinate-nucleotide adenylyltransferase [Pyrinomonadaceae bacterium]|nr:nicotinate-nucleotide adenylyltransferase [Pyrinomonadaceae bacterium]